MLLSSKNLISGVLKSRIDDAYEHTIEVDLKCDYDNHKFARSGLIAKYEKEIVLPSEMFFKELALILGIS